MATITFRHVYIIRCFSRETSIASIHEDEAVVLVICAAVFVVFQLEIAFLKLYLIRRKRTIVGHFIDDGIDDATFANEMPLKVNCSCRTAYETPPMTALPAASVRSCTCNHAAYCTRALGSGQ